MTDNEHYDEGIGYSAPPVQGYGYPSPGIDPSIAAMRWNADPIVADLYRRLGALHIVETAGTVSYQKIENVKAKMNLEGVQTMLSIIEGVINPHVSLSNLQEEEANELIRQILHQVAMELSYSCDAYEIRDGSQGSIMAILKPLVFSQVKRAVKGHESKNFNTQHIEHNTSQNVTQGAPRRGMLPSLFGGARR